MDSCGECSSEHGSSRGDLARARWREEAEDAKTESDGGQVAAQRIVHVDVRTAGRRGVSVGGDAETVRPLAGIRVRLPDRLPKGRCR